MKAQKPVFIILGLVFISLGITSKNYAYIATAILFIIAGFIKRNKIN